MPELDRRWQAESISFRQGWRGISPWMQVRGIVAADPDVLLIAPCGFSTWRGRRTATDLPSHHPRALPELAPAQSRFLRISKSISWRGQSKTSIDPAQTDGIVVESLEIIGEVRHPSELFSFGHEGFRLAPQALLAEARGASRRPASQRGDGGPKNRLSTAQGKARPFARWRRGELTPKLGHQRPDYRSRYRFHQRKMRQRRAKKKSARRQLSRATDRRSAHQALRNVARSAVGVRFHVPSPGATSCRKVIGSGPPTCRFPCGRGRRKKIGSVSRKQRIVSVNQHRVDSFLGPPFPGHHQLPATGRSFSRGTIIEGTKKTTIAKTFVPGDPRRRPTRSWTFGYK